MRIIRNVIVSLFLFSIVASVDAVTIPESLDLPSSKDSQIFGYKVVIWQTTDTGETEFLLRDFYILNQDYGFCLIPVLANMELGWQNCYTVNAR